MNLLESFKNYLLSQKNASSPATVKNYIADVKKFILWTEQKLQHPFAPETITEEALQEFITEKKKEFSASSVERQLSSMKKFFFFLKMDGHVMLNPFDAKAPKQLPQDPFHLKEFKDFLYVYNASRLTIKNYLIDIKQFISWAQSVAVAESSYVVSDRNIFTKIDDHMLQEYSRRLLAEGRLSPISINRKLSSLRKYLTWASSQGLLQNTITALPSNVPSQVIGNRQQTIGMDNDVKSAFSQNDEAQFASEGVNFSQDGSELRFQEKFRSEQSEDSIEPQNPTYSKIPPIRLFQKLLALGSLGLDYLMVIPAAQAASAIQHRIWILRGKPVFTNQPALLEQQKAIIIPKVKNIAKAFYNPLAISITHFPWYKKVLFHVRYTRPSWYHKYHQLAVARYFNWAVLIIFCAMIGFGLYSSFFSNARKSQTLAALPTAPPRVLSFQGRLTDNNDTPITAANTHLRFAIYNSPTASGAALLWQEVDNVNPDTDGDFSTLLGDGASCGNPLTIATGACQIPSTLFTQNNALWLGASVENTSELAPRQQLATVAFATNSETLQGLPPLTQGAPSNANTVLVLDSAGNLDVGALSGTIFQASQGQFTLSGTTLLLQTGVGTNGNVTLAPDGSGKIDLQKPLQNSTLNNNIPSAAGSVEVDDLLSVLATSSGQSAFTINQTSTGPLISASTSGIAKFTVDNAGNMTAAGNVTGQTIYTGGGTSYYINNALSNLNSLNLAADFTISGNVNSTLSPSVANTDTFSLGISPSQEWLNLYVKNIFSGGQQITQLWQENLGVLSPLHLTDDLAIGGSSTASAKFQIFGGSGNATTSGTLTFNSATQSANLIAATGKAGLTIGDTNTGNIILNGDNVGIGTTTPTQKLDVNGNIQAGEFFDQQNNSYFLNPADATQSLLTAGNVGIGTTNTSSFKLQVAGDVGPNTTNAFDLGSLALQWRNIYGQHLFTNGIELTQLWQENLGVLSPLHITDDLAVGGTATLSAKFQVFGLSGNATTSGNFTFAGTSATNLIAAQNKAGLTIGDTRTGNIILNGDNVGIGTTSPSAFKVQVAGSVGPSATNTYDLGSLALQWNNVYANAFYQNGQQLTQTWQRNLGVLSPLNITDDIAVGGTSTSSAKFQVFSATGNATTSGTLTFNSSSGATNLIAATNKRGLTIGDTNTGNIILNGDNVGIGTTAPNAFKVQVAGSVGPSATNTYDLGSLALQWNNVYGQHIFANGIEVTQLWQENAGALSPLHITDDLLLGATSTTSARFAVTNIAGGTPTASVSAGLNSGMSIDASGNLVTYSAQSLTLGSSKTGNINIGTDSTSRAINIGNATGATSISERVGTGSYSLDGVATSNFVLGASTVGGAITVGGTAQTGTLTLGQSTDTNIINIGSGITGSLKTQTINIGNGAGGGTAINVSILSGAGTSGNGTLALGNNPRVGTIDLGNVAAGVTRIVTIAGGNSANDDTVNILAGAPSVGTQTVNIMTGNATGGTQAINIGTGTSAKTISVGGTGANTINLGNTQTGGSINIGGALTSGTITIGNSSGLETGSIIIGDGTGAQTIDLGNGSGLKTINIGGSGANVISLGSTQTGGTINIGNNSDTTTIKGAAFTPGGVGYGTGANALAFSTAGSSGQCLLSNGSSAPTFGLCTFGNQNYWNLQQEALFPYDFNADLLTGTSTGATGSAKFAVTGMAGSLVPAASVSATLASGGTGTGITIKGDGTIQSLVNGQLTIGGSTTGNIVLKPKNGTGGTVTIVGLGTGVVHSISDVLSATTVDLQNDISNTLRVDHGGTGVTSLASGSILYGGGGLTMTERTIGNTNDMLAVVGGVPVWSPYATHSALFVTNNAELNTISSLTNQILPTTNGVLNLGDGAHFFGTIYANNIIAPVGSGTSGFWQLANSVLAPVNTLYDLAVGGSATGSATPWQVFAGTVGVSTAGTATSSGGLTFRGSTTNISQLNGGSIIFKTSPGGDAGLSAALTIANSGAITAASTLAVNGTALTTSNSTFSLLNTNAGTLSFAGGTSTFTIAQVSTNTTFNGNLNLGTNTSNTLAINGKITSDLVPFTDNTYSIGTNTNTWANVYTHNLFVPVASVTDGLWQVVGTGNVISPTYNWQDLGLGGTGTASAKFQVFASQFLTNSSLNSGIIPAGTATSSGSLTFRGSATNIAMLNGGTLGFYISPGGDAGLNTNSALFIANTGNIGIGTTNPDHPFVVRTTTDSNIARFFTSGALAANIQIDNLSGGNQSKITFQDTGNDKFQIGKQTDNTFFIYSNQFARDIFDYDTGGYMLLQRDAGAVGIGTASGIGNAALVVNQKNWSGLGDIFSASTSGVAKFTIANDGTIKNSLIPNITDTYNLGSDPTLGGKEWDTLYVRQIVTPSTGGTAGFWQLSIGGVLAPANTTNDLVIGGNSTASAKFQVFGSGPNAGNTTITSSSVTGNPLAIFANSLTTSTVATFSATALTSGNFLSLLAPNPTATFSATSFSGNLINIASANHTYMTLNNTDLTIGGHKNNTTISNVKKVFVYDTSGDSDGGRWTTDERAQGSSWYNETLNTAIRGSTRPFPRKSILVATTTGLNIYDAKDNSLWMTFTGGPHNMITTSSGTNTGLTALNGEIYITYTSSGTSFGLNLINFIQDKSYSYGNNVRYTSDTKGIINRNVSGSGDAMEAEFGTNAGIAINSANDVSAAIINGKTYFAVATTGGSRGAVTVWNESEMKFVANFGGNVNASKVWLTSAGSLYALIGDASTATTYALKVKNSIQNITPSIANDTQTFDVVYANRSTSNYGVTTTDNNTFSNLTLFKGPAATTAAVLNPTSLAVTEGTSTSDGVSNTIYLGEGGSGGAVAALQENTASPAAGIIKYYKKDFITDDMVGDIRGFWPLNESSGSVTDAGPLGNVLTASSSGVTYGVSGVRGTALSFNGTTGYMWCPNGTCGGVSNLGISGNLQKISVGAWIKTSANPAQQVILSKFNSGVTGSYALSVMTGGRPRFTLNSISLNLDSIRSVNDGNWHYIVGTYDGAMAKLYIDGQIDGQKTQTGSFSTDTTDFLLGAWKVFGFVQNWFSGSIDEPFVSASALTGSEVTHNYQVGYRALQSHTAQTIRNTTIAADASQQLAGNNSNVQAVAASMRNGQIYVGTSNGGISAIGIDTDTVKDVYNTSINTTDDMGASWGSNNNFVNSISIGQSYGTGTLLAFGSNNGGSGGAWMESQDTTLKDFLASSYNPFGTTLNQTNINVDGIFRVTNQLSTRLDNMAYLATSSASLDLFQVDNYGNILSRALTNNANYVRFQDPLGNNLVSIDSTNLGNAVLTINQPGGVGGDILAASVSGNPVFRMTPGASPTAGALMYAGKFFDLDSTNYFLDPAATGTSLTTAGSIGLGTLTTNRSGATAAATLTIETTAVGATGVSPTIEFSRARGTFENGSEIGVLRFMAGTSPTQRSAISVNMEDTLGTSGNLNFWTTSTGGSITDNMVIKGNGNVGIGTTNPIAKLHLANTSGETLLIVGNNVSGGDGAIMLNGNGGQTNWLISANRITGSALEFIPSTAAGGSTFSTAAMIINGSGNVGLGTTSPAAQLHAHDSFMVSNGTTTQRGLYFSEADDDLYVGGSNSQAGDILIKNSSATTTVQFAPDNDSYFNGGNLGIGTTGPVNRLTVNNPAGGTAIAQIGNGCGTTYIAITLWKTSIPNSGTCDEYNILSGPGDAHLYLNAPSGNQMHLRIANVSAFDIDQNRTIYGINNTNAFSSTVECRNANGALGFCSSDGRLKENFRYWDNSISALSLIDKLKPLTFDWKGSVSPLTGEWIDGAKDDTGFIAQDVQSVIPNLVTTQAGGYWVFQKDELVPYAIKGLQELAASHSAMLAQVQQLQNFELTSTGDIAIQDTNSSVDFTIPHYFTLSDALGTPITRMGAFLELAVGNLRVGSGQFGQLFTNSLAIATTNVTIAGQQLSDYIVSVVNNAISNGAIQGTESNSPIASVDELHTHLISPLGSNNAIAIRLNNSRVEILKDASSSAVASIDNAGNATFAGALNSQNLAVNGDATVSGTLHADKIEANSIVGLQAAVGTLSAQNITNVTNMYFASPSGTPNGENNSTGYYGSGNNNNGLLAGGYANIASFSAYFSYVPYLKAATAEFDQGLMSLGPTSLTDTSISGTLSIGTQLILADNSINVFGSNFEIQPLRQGGISFESGLVAIDTSGNLTVNGNAVFNGNIAVNTISPLAAGKDVNVNLTDDSTHNSSFIIHTASNSSVLAINQFGDLIASGAGTFSKLNLSLVQPALAVSATEQVATGSAGTAQIGAHQSQLTIDNVHVTANSLIYITPVGQNTVIPYLLRQVPGTSFTVGIQAAQLVPVPFNWLIVN